MTQIGAENLFSAAFKAEQEAKKAGNESVKINSLELENVKRVKAVRLEPAANGLTVVGGKNNQGKTSVLDAITYTLGGGDYKPSNVKREGSMVDPYMKAVLSNGIVVERKGKNSSLTVTDPSGKKAGQTLLNSFISTFALDLPKFMNASDKEKARSLLQIIGVEDQLKEFDAEEERLFNERLVIGRTEREKRGHAEQLPQWDNVPEGLISASDLINAQQAILLKNAKNKEARDNVERIRWELHKTSEEAETIRTKIRNLSADLEAVLQKEKTLKENLAGAESVTAGLEDESTTEIEASIANIEIINARVRDNMAKEQARMEADNYKQKYEELTAQIEKIRDDRMKLLEGVNMPLKGLSVDHGALIYNGQPWDNMSGSDQLKVATAIVRKLNPKCGFVLLDKLEQMDLDTLKEFGKWLEQEKLQAIATRVSTGDECTIYIEDGYSVDHDGNKTAESMIRPAEMMKTPDPDLTKPKWEAGKF